jgi:ferredoxin-NADP reductase
MSHAVRVLMKEFVTHDVRRFILEKPRGFEFVPGQGALVALDRQGMKDDPHPFTPTSLADDHVLEFTIKGYPKHHGLTEKLHGLAPGDTVQVGDVFGTIRYRGPGVFIAAGAGITPFIAIMRQQAKKGDLKGCSILFSNKTQADVILEMELRHYLGNRCTFTLTRETRPGYERGRISADFLKRHVKSFKQAFYVCGPHVFVEDVKAALEELGAKAESVVLEE